MGLGIFIFSETGFVQFRLHHVAFVHSVLLPNPKPPSLSTLSQRLTSQQPTSEATGASGFLLRGFNVSYHNILYEEALLFTILRSLLW